MNKIFEEFSNALKSKFCEFQSSTFSVSFVISAIFVNHKYLMIYYSNIDPDRKLLMLEYQGINLWLPILFALLYVYLYPYAAKEFYSRNLEFSNEFKKTKVNKLSKRIIDEDDAKSFVAEIEELTEKLDEQTQSVSKMQGKYTVKIENLENSYIKEASQYKTDIQNLESKCTQKISELTSTIDTMSSTTNTLEAKVQLVEQENEKFKFENQKLNNEVSLVNAEKHSLFAIIQDIDSFKLLPMDKKIETLLLANIAWSQIDDVLKLEKGYTQKARLNMKLPNRSNTTDEMILREINRLGEADIPSLLRKFHDLDESSLTVKIQTFQQENKITIINGTKHYCLTEASKRILNLK